LYYYKNIIFRVFLGGKLTAVSSF